VGVVAVPIDAGCVEERERGAVRGPSRAFELRLESMSHQQDEPGVLDRLDIVGRELEVVRLGARGRQVRDLDVGPADLLGDEGQGIEGGDDGVPARARRVTASREGGGDRADHDRADQTENDSQSQRRLC
jgi:hypothetical protein